MAESPLSTPDPICFVRLRHSIGLLTIDVEFAIRQPWTVLFGPSGSGKTTILRAMAGLVRPDKALIVSRRQTIAADAGKHRFVPVHKRNTRLVAQRTALFPHMTVQQNVLFGVRPASDGTTATTFAEIAIEHFRLKALLRSMPSTLSGGEQRRVAIASAVASAMSLGDGAILLLDEPFSGLDAPLRDELIVDLRHSLAALSIPVLSVTHDVGEAFQLGAEVIQIAQGRVVAQGPVAQVLAAERIRLLQQLNPAT